MKKIFSSLGLLALLVASSAHAANFGPEAPKHITIDNTCTYFFFASNSTWYVLLATDWNPATYQQFNRMLLQAEVNGRQVDGVFFGTVPACANYPHVTYLQLD